MSSLSTQSSKYDVICLRTLRRFERYGFLKRVIVKGMEGVRPAVSVRLSEIHDEVGEDCIRAN